MDAEFAHKEIIACQWKTFTAFHQSVLSFV